jgi:RNA polymerase sigma-70 factor (ECF subfamily)
VNQLQSTVPLFLAGLPRGRTRVPDAAAPDWDAVTGGERDALEWLFTRWMPVTLQWCRRLGGPRVDPEQAAQDVFVTVLRRVYTVRSAEVFPSWLFAVTRRILAQHRRRAWSTRWDAGTRIEDLQPIDAGIDPERAQRIRDIWAAVDALPIKLRETLVLCDIEERTALEASELLDVPVGTVRSRLRRAREEFQLLALRRGLWTEEGP